jgi:outer membrane protein OmpA-like peptidoglycan-associated protein
MKKILYVFLVGILIVGLIGCSSMNKKEKGAVIGAAAGAVVGGVIGNQAGSTTAGVIMGAAIGGAAGAVIGNYMDKQAEEMERDLEGAKVERIGEGIKITFPSGILFDVNKSTIQPAGKDNLQKLAEILNKYDETDILIEGHTDSTGPEEYNMDLSIRRANSVGTYLAGNEVSPARFKLLGYGETQPVASNETVEGRQQNRRVEIAIFANDDLKKAAQKKADEQG